MDPTQHFPLNQRFDELADVDLCAVGQYGQGRVHVGRQLETDILAIQAHCSGPGWLDTQPLIYREMCDARG